MISHYTDFPPLNFTKESNRYYDITFEFLDCYRRLVQLHVPLRLHLEDVFRLKDMPLLLENLPIKAWPQYE